MDRLIEVMYKFKYKAQATDRNDLRVYAFNNSLIAVNKDLPKKDCIYLDVQLLIDQFKIDCEKLGLSLGNEPTQQNTLSQSYTSMGINVLVNLIQQTIKCLEIMKRNRKIIEEKDLRRILFEMLKIDQRN